MKKLLSASVAFAAAVGMLTVGLVTAHAEVTGTGTVGDPYIVTTADDWNDVAKSGYIKLNGNIDTTIAAKTSGTMTLDLNGYTITTSGASIVEVLHDFVLTDSTYKKGAIINTNTGSSSYGIKCALKNTDIKIKDAVIKAGGQAVMINATGTSVDIENTNIDGGQYALNIVNGSLSINGDTIINSDTDYKGYALNASGGTVTVESGIFNYNGTTNTAVVSGTADVTINGGTFSNANKSRGAIATTKTFNNTLKIYDGVFTATNNSNSILDSNEGGDYAPKIEIYGGNFTGAFGKIKPAISVTDISVMGGTFSFDPTSYVDTEICDVTSNDDLTWTVSQKSDIPESETVSLTPVDDGNIIEGSDGYGRVFTFEADLSGKLLSDVELKYGEYTATVLEGNDSPTIDGNAKFGIIVKSADKENIESFDVGNVTILFK